MEENQGDFREEQRTYCKIRGLLGKNASEIKSELDTVYGENTLPYRSVAIWVSYVKEGRSSVKDKAHPGRPVSYSCLANRHSGSVVERPLCDREVAGSIPGRVIPKTLKMVLAALSLGAQH